MDNLLNVPIHLIFSGKPAFPRLRQDLDSIAAMAFLQYRQMFQPGLYLAGFEGPSHQERGSKGYKSIHDNASTRNDEIRQIMICSQSLLI